MGVPILPPDINGSDLAFKVTPDGVRFGLRAVKNVGEGAIASILECRAHSGQLSSLYPLCEEVDLRLVNKRVFESLIKAGAFDSTLPPSSRRAASGRAQLAALVDRALEHGNRFQRDRERGQTQLFETETANADPSVALPDVPAWTEAEQLGYEKESLGLYLSGHPIARYGDQLEAAGARAINSLEREKGAVMVGGIVSGYRPLKTKRGAAMAVFTLEDREGTREVVVFPKTYEKCAAELVVDRLVLVTGKLDTDEETARVLADDIRPIETLASQVGRTLLVRLTGARHNRTTFEALSELLQIHRGYGQTVQIQV